MEPREELQLILKKHYTKNWSVWTHSPACFLSDFELRIIEESLSKKTLRKSARQLGISSLVFMMTLIKAIHKLKSKIRCFHEWNATFYTHHVHSGQEEKCLVVPIHLLPLSLELKQWLFYTHQLTLKDVITNFSELDLIVLYGFPEDMMFELKKYLGPYQSRWFGDLNYHTQQSSIFEKPTAYQLKEILKVHLN